MEESRAARILDHRSKQVYRSPRERSVCHREGGSPSVCRRSFIEVLGQLLINLHKISDDRSLLVDDEFVACELEQIRLLTPLARDTIVGANDAFELDFLTRTQLVLTL